MSYAHALRARVFSPLPLRRLCRTALALLASAGLAAPDTAVTMQGLSVQLYPSGVLSVNSALSLTSSLRFGPYGGSLPVYFRIRTYTGGGQITVTASEFTPTGGPTLASRQLQYSCDTATMGSACTGQQTVSAGQTPVVSVPRNQCMGTPCGTPGTASVQLRFTLENDPQYSTANYSTQLLFTISST